MDALEKVIRPIVEGQVRGFTKDHPEVLDAVKWYKGSKHDKQTTFINSISKRVTRDLLCPMNRMRIEAALFALWESEKSSVAPGPALDGANIGSLPDAASNSAVEDSDCGSEGAVGTLTDSPSAALLPRVDFTERKAA